MFRRLVRPTLLALCMGLALAGTAPARSAQRQGDGEIPADAIRVAGRV